MAEVHYRVLTGEDGAAWQALREIGARDFPMGFLVTEDETRAGADKARKILDAGTVRGVFAGDTLIGFCGFRPQMLERTRHRAELGPFFVDAAWQGRGAAAVLMNGVLAEARALGIAQVELFVDTENYRAIAFYERQGFERVATHPDGVRIDGVSRDDHFYRLVL